MEQFLTQFSTIPKEFINDFFMIAKDEYNENDIIIQFDIVCKWLNVIKGNLKKVLIDNFEKNYDYIIQKKTKKHKKSNGASFYDEILITPNCFKGICMISLTPKAKEVRKYFIEMEKLIKRYYITIKDQMYKTIGLLKNNQKPKLNIKTGVLYIIEAQNTDVTLYKLGKSNNLKNRLNTYNSGNANDIIPLFIISVKDIDHVEKCVKNACKRFQYRKYKEVYQIDIEVLKDVILKCDNLSNMVSNEFSKMNKHKLKNKIKKMKTNENKYFIYIDK